ncbi:hypothetical protein AOC36_01080 [Erysipelothrix larvae]|uniref:Uncharacterized protein n=1 Tax=Erysipelothrix larvae TaxID=1514105 RepID=A0A0X8GY84_9FIRM|nr:hypothetical protein [Erysipelothrix larvae]AMC92635.1 hypothetical protein AOC36_01080 [Erysipelothrix larvae]
MNNYKSESSLDLDPKLTICLIWIVSLITSAGISKSNGLSTVIIIVSTLLLLIYEKKNTLVRNHAAQCLALNLATILVSILVNSIFRILVALVFWIPVLNVVSTSMLIIAMTIVSVFFVLINLLGLVKSFKFEPVSLPYISKYAEIIEQAIGR